MLKRYYSYIAVVSFDPDGISIDFPDLPGCFTCADNEEEVPKMAREVLGLHLWSMENDNEPIPAPSPLQHITLEENDTTMFVDVFMPAIRDKINNRVMKKTLTIPRWLNDEAEKHDVNFSQVLQTALKEYLQLDMPIAQ